MRVAAIRLHGSAGRPTIELRSIARGLTTIYSPPKTGKTAVADLLAHALFGRVPTAAPSGEVVVADEGGRYRMRRKATQNGVARLTVAALDGSPVDQGVIRRLVGGLTPTVLAPLCAPNIRDPHDPVRLLSPQFAREFQMLCGGDSPASGRRLAELAARRDVLAQELETRIADDRRTSKELESQWRHLDHVVRDKQQEAAALEQRLKAVEAALVETDTRLRYRRLELNTELRWSSDDACDLEPPVAELEVQIERCRGTLAELSEREATLRARLSQVQSPRGASAATIKDQQMWLSVARQLTADLSGEVSRLARASASQKCVCHDAHPRLRPIAETIERQLGVLESLIDAQRQALGAAEINAELSHLTRSQGELRQQLEQLLESRQTATRIAPAVGKSGAAGKSPFSAADAEQLESRRLELEQERFRLVEQLRTCTQSIRDHRAQRDAIERQRAALLSARSIEHVQRELAAVQQKLEGESTAHGSRAEALLEIDGPSRASDYLARLTNGDLTRLLLVDGGRNYCVVKYGQTVTAESLTAAERVQVHLSLCLALLSEAARRGIWLPLVLDEPFEQLDPRGIAAVATLLEEFCRQGHQVIVFTAQRAAAERFAAIGVAVQEIARQRQPDREANAQNEHESTKKRNPAAPAARKANPPKRTTDGKVPKRRSRDSATDGSSLGQSDAA